VPGLLIVKRNILTNWIHPAKITMEPENQLFEEGKSSCKPFIFGVQNVKKLQRCKI